MAEKSNSPPDWLLPFLSGDSYFSGCEVHPAARKNQKNYFCISCVSSPLCATCVGKCHSYPMADHHLLQVRKSSHHDAVRVSELDGALDLSQVQIYKINGEDIVHLNKRPQGSQQRLGDNPCRICSRNLMSSKYRYCCLDCKREASISDARISLVPGMALTASMALTTPAPNTPPASSPATFSRFDDNGNLVVPRRKRIQTRDMGYVKSKNFVAQNPDRLIVEAEHEEENPVESRYSKKMRKSGLSYDD